MRTLCARISPDGSTIEMMKKLDTDYLLSKTDAIALGKSYWLPVVEETQDTSTNPPWVKTTNTGYQIEADRVYKLVTKVDMTQAEIDAEKAATRDMIADGFDEPETYIYVLGKILFQVVNDVRQLKGQQAITPAQFKAYIRNQLNA